MKNWPLTLSFLVFGDSWKGKQRGVGEISFSWAQMLILCWGSGCKQKIRIINVYIYNMFTCMIYMYWYDIIYILPFMGSGRTWQGPASNMKATSRLDETISGTSWGDHERHMLQIKTFMQIVIWRVYFLYYWCVIILMWDDVAIVVWNNCINKWMIGLRNELSQCF